jgi:hypothetical protein
MQAVIYIPAVIRMATDEEKLARCTGTQRRKLRTLISAAQAADDAMMSRKPDDTDPIWCAACDAAETAGRALFDYACQL